MSPLSLDSSDVESSDKATTRRTNSMRREPPKILVNRVPPAGIGKYKGSNCAVLRGLVKKLAYQQPISYDVNVV